MSTINRHRTPHPPSAAPTPTTAWRSSCLAMLDSARPLAGAVLVAESDGLVLAAISLKDGRVVADPFFPTADLVDAAARPRRAPRDRATRRAAGSSRGGSSRPREHYRRLRSLLLARRRRFPHRRRRRVGEPGVGLRHLGLDVPRHPGAGARPSRRCYGAGARFVVAGVLHARVPRPRRSLTRQPPRAARLRRGRHAAGGRRQRPGDRRRAGRPVGLAAAADRLGPAVDRRLPRGRRRPHPARRRSSACSPGSPASRCSCCPATGPTACRSARRW